MIEIHIIVVSDQVTEKIPTLRRVDDIGRIFRAVAGQARGEVQTDRFASACIGIHIGRSCFAFGVGKAQVIFVVNGMVV